jgi:hypothetical protein
MCKTFISLIAFFWIVSFKANAQHVDCKENYFNTPKKVAKLKPMFDFMNLQNGAVIASIGKKRLV